MHNNFLTLISALLANTIKILTELKKNNQHRKLCVGAREYHDFRIICKRNSCVHVKEISALGKDFEFIKDKSKTRKT